MPRRPRICPGEMVFHILNRRVDRQLIFESRQAYESFESLLLETKTRMSTRLCAYCLMPNHWHLVLWPREDREASAFMHLLSTWHASVWKRRRGKLGDGHLYQSRFKSFPVQNDRHYLSVVRYVERNALRANLVSRAEDWRYSSLWRRVHSSNGENAAMLNQGPVELPRDWVDRVNQPQTAGELAAIRLSVERGRPFGTDAWQKRVAKSLRLESTFRNPGRPGNSSREHAPRDKAQSSKRTI